MGERRGKRGERGKKGTGSTGCCGVKKKTYGDTSLPFFSLLEERDREREKKQKIEAVTGKGGGTREKAHRCGEDLRTTLARMIRLRLFAVLRVAF